MDKPTIKLPCGIICDDRCSIKEKILEIEGHLELADFEGFINLLDKFFETYRIICSDPEFNKKYPLEIAFPTLFDLIATAEYARVVAADSGWIYCKGEQSDRGPSLYFPYVKTCPRCSVNEGSKPIVKSNKPQSAVIGKIASDATGAILKKMLQYADSDLQIAVSTDIRGDIDFVLFNDDMLVLCEVKSSPLVVYPLEVRLNEGLTEVRDGLRQQKTNHSPASVQLRKEEINIYIPHKNLRIPVGKRDNEDWPYPGLITFLDAPSNLEKLLEAWKELYEVYKSNSADRRRWITFGCGGGVDDSKNNPGLDRTDDIKKGTYQVLKYGVSYKEKCVKRILYTALITNFYPLRTLARYFDDINDVLWTKEKYEIKNQPLPPGVRVFYRNGVFNLYDAVIGLTGAWFNEDKLRRIFGFNFLKEKLLQ